MEAAQKTAIVYLITKGTWGGAQRYVYDLATSLPRDEYEVSVAFGGSGLLAEKLARAGIRAYTIPALQRDISLRADYAAFRGLLRLLREQQPDIVHLNSSKAAVLGALAARLAGIQKIIFTAHGWPFWEQRATRARLSLWFSSWLTALLSHHVICISDFDRAVARRMPLIGPKTVRIYNGAPQEILPPREEHAGVRVLTVAELTNNKNLFVGIDAIVRACANNGDITYDIMGEGELQPALEQHIEKKHTGGFISLLGFVPDASTQYNNYDIFFLPSKKEGLPYVLLEAARAGLPVVASRVGGIPEIVTDGEDGILKGPNDTEGFAEALSLLAGDKKMRQRLGAALRLSVEKKFSFKEMLRATLSLYNARP